MANALYYGDNLRVLRDGIATESVDLVYLDPPFNSHANYNILFKVPSGKGAGAQIEAFEDTWRWGEDSARAFAEVLDSSHAPAAELLRAMRSFLGDNDMMAYLAMMAVRLVELHRVLKPTGSLYLHCDPTASHYLKILLDGIFGGAGYRNEISWRRSSAHNDTRQGRKQFGNVRDILFFYAKSRQWTWNPQYIEYDRDYVSSMYRFVEAKTNRRYRKDNLTAARAGGDTRYEWRVKRRIGGGEWEADLADEHEAPQEGWEYKGVLPYGQRIWGYSKENMIKFARAGRIAYSESGMPNYKRYLDEMSGVALQNDWNDIPAASGHEYLGYQTQKPVALAERIIAASSNPGDLVLDPFCGCGTTIHAAQKLGRAWIGIDITHLAISLIERRLKDAFPGVSFDVHGTPKDLESAIDLARRDKDQFRWWAVSRVEARPCGGRKKGADRGIDGLLFFRSDKEKTEKALVSVTGEEKIEVGRVCELSAVVAREQAAIGVLISPTPPTRAMESEAAAAGLFETPFETVPKIQIITLAELFQGKRPRIPRRAAAATFRADAREASASQARLL